MSVKDALGIDLQNRAIAGDVGEIVAYEGNIRLVGKVADDDQLAALAEV